jgi:PAS domain S-box-containing protein
MTEKPTYEELERRISELEAELERQRRSGSPQQEQRKYQRLFELESDALVLIDSTDGLILEANRAATEMYGYTREELLALRNTDLSAEPDSTRQATRQEHKVVPVRYHRRKDGSVFPVEITASHFEWQGRKAHVAAIREISRRVEAEKLFTSTLGAVDSMLVVIDRDHRIVLCNWKDHEWVPDEERESRPFCYKVMKNLDAPCAHCPPVKTFQDGRIRRYEDRNPVDMSYKEISVIPIFDEQGNVQYVLENVRDVTAGKRSEEALRISQERFLTVLDSIDATIYVADLNTYEILFMNRHMVESFGRDMTGHLCWEVFRGESAPCPHCTNRLLVDGSGRPTGVQVWQGRNPRTGRWYINHDRAIEWTDGRLVRLQIATDITDLIRMEEELRRAQKMEAIGTLAGGIAHNFNNTLMGIQGRASLMMMDKDESHPDHEHLRGIEEYVRSAAELTRDLLGFAKGGKYEAKPTDLNRLIRNEIRLFGRTRKEIRIEEKLEENLWTVEVDQGQVRQALLNLYVNAWQAMPGGGDLNVRTGNVTLVEEDVKAHGVRPGRYVRVAVADTGVGMDASTAEKVFDPFFTTRTMGRGTGLGLASVYGIVKNHGGFISVESEKGVGTTFTIFLPASDKGVIEENEPEPRIVTGTGTILLVDDEEMVLEVGEQLLARLGYRVLAAGGGEAALDLYERRNDEIDLVVLDMVMPGLSGGEVFDRMKAADPDVRVLLSSGYTIDGQAQEILDRGCRGFIQKPFDLETLSRKVREALDTP